MPRTPLTTSAQRRILVVDDDESVLAGLVATLERDGHAVAVAQTGDAAFEALARTTFDLVITDLKMPGVSGLEVVDRVCKTHAAAKVVVISGYPTRTAAEEAMRRGADDFLLKPVHSSRLLQTVAQQLGSE
jgi:DNA-binding NtrC family response regulator